MGNGRFRGKVRGFTTIDRITIHITDVFPCDEMGVSNVMGMGDITAVANLQSLFTTQKSPLTT